MKWVSAVWQWSIKANYRTWLMHGLLAALGTLILGGLGDLKWVGVVIVWSIYLGREIGQLEPKIGAITPDDVKDAFMDAVVPMTTAGLVGVWLW